MRRFSHLGIWLVVVTVVPPVAAQRPDDARTWRLDGLRTGFCVQILIAPAADVLRRIPAGLHARPADEADDLPLSLSTLIAGQPELGGWTPSGLCFFVYDTIQTSEFTLADKSGRHPTLVAAWTVAATDSAGHPLRVALELFASSDRLVRAAQRAGNPIHAARVTLAKVPVQDENGAASPDDRFQFKTGKTVVTWDGTVGEPAGADDRAAAIRDSIRITWVAVDGEMAGRSGNLSLAPESSRPMSGSLKVEGRDDLAKALKGSPSRFAGPEYRGGGGVLALVH